MYIPFIGCPPSPLVGSKMHDACIYIHVWRLRRAVSPFRGAAEESDLASSMISKNETDGTLAHVMNHSSSLILSEEMYALCENSKPQGLEEHLKHELFESNRSMVVPSEVLPSEARRKKAIWPALPQY